MENFAVDLDQALNDLERLESEGKPPLKFKSRILISGKLYTNK